MFSMRPHNGIKQDRVWSPGLLGRGQMKKTVSIFCHSFGHTFCKGVQDDHLHTMCFFSHPCPSHWPLHFCRDWRGHKAQLQELGYTFWSSFSSPFWLVSGSGHHNLKTLCEFRCKHRKIMYYIAFRSTSWNQT